MIKTLIVEDEPKVRASLKKMLSLIRPDLEIVAETGYVTEAVTIISAHQPHLVFLDIQLEDGTGFEILDQLENVNFKVIFTTAYSHYSIMAFKVSAIDYLLKPIDPTELEAALNRAVERIEKDLDHQELIEVLRGNLHGRDKKIVLRSTDRQFILNQTEIVHLMADSAYTIFVTKDQKITISKNLKHYQDLLDDRFVRCHQSHLVNTQHIVGM
ncbi:MAG: LytR/AlgR family response regulator transcription factor [Flavobacteriaceae bacterium]